jgi:hypothetical protein
MKRFAQVVMGLGVISPDGDGPAITGHRLIQLAQVLERIAEIIVRLGVIVVDLQGLAATGDGVIRLS